jgi:uracil-DNA glycosylase
MTHSPRLPFAHWSGSRSPSIVFVGEAHGASEEETGRPFVGQAGRELFAMLGEALGASANDTYSVARDAHRFGLGWVGARDAWLHAQGFAMTNVLALRPPDNKIPALCVSKKELPNGYSLPPIDQGQYLDPQYLGELDRLSAELVESRPNLVVALGNVACWALMGTRGIKSLRGTTRAESLSGLGLKTLPTYHPSYIMRSWPDRQIAVGDLMKGLRESVFAEIRRPSRSVIVNPFIEDVETWSKQVLLDVCPISCDIETAKGQITMVGFARASDNAIVIPFRNFANVANPHYWTLQDEVTAWLCVRSLLLAQNPKIFQNGLYDIQYFMAFGLRVMNAHFDTMLMHHSIFPELEKGLGFLGSVYSSEPAWKLMRKRKADEPEKADE